MSDSDLPATPNQQTDQTEGFMAYLVQSVISNPRTRAQIGSAVRGALIALGSGWASTHADAINVLVGIAIAILSAIWGVYQKYCVDRKIARLKDKIMEAPKP